MLGITWSKFAVPIGTGTSCERARRALMTAADVVEILEWLSGGDVEVWLDGGWGVDALVGEEDAHTRIWTSIVLDDHASQLRDPLSKHGFEHARGPDWNFVLRDDRGREVDVHPVRVDEEGNGHFHG